MGSTCMHPNWPMNCTGAMSLVQMTTMILVSRANARTLVHMYHASTYESKYKWIWLSAHGDTPRAVNMYLCASLSYNTETPPTEYYIVVVTLYTSYITPGLYILGVTASVPFWTGALCCCERHCCVLYFVVTSIPFLGWWLSTTSSPSEMQTKRESRQESSYSGVVPDGTTTHICRLKCCSEKFTRNGSW